MDKAKCDYYIRTLETSVRESSAVGIDTIIMDVDAANDIISTLKEWEHPEDRPQELVRCKDCKYCEYPEAEKEWCKKWHLHRKAETWFCADGKRREDDA